MNAQKLLDLLFAPFDLASNVWDATWQGFRNFVREVILLKIIFTLILIVGGIYHYLAVLLAVLDRWLHRIETTIIFVATLGMTGLVEPQRARLVAMLDVLAEVAVARSAT